MATKETPPIRQGPPLTIEGTLPGTPHVLRRVNRIQVLSAIRRLGPVSRPALADATGLSKVTVNEVVRDLLSLDLVTEEASTSDGGHSRPGPRPKLLSFRHDGRYVVGIDIGAATALVFVSDLAGESVTKHRISTEGARTRAQLLQKIRNGVDRALSQAQVEADSVVAVGVGTPGVVDPDEGTISLAPQLPEWDGVNLAEELTMFADSPVIVANEVQLAILGEQWRGAAQGIENAAYLHIGIGVGLGMIVGGHLLTGASGAAGEIGYLPLGSEDDPERPDEVGRFEWAVGGPAYARAAQRSITDGKGEGLLAHAQDEPVDAEVVFAAAAAGDVEAATILESLIELTAVGLASLTVILDPHTVIVGGGLSRAGSQLLDPLRRRVGDLVPLVPHFAAAALGDEAVAVGALRMAIERWESDVFTLKN